MAVIAWNMLPFEDSVDSMNYIRENLAKYPLNDPVFRETYAITQKTKLFAMALHVQYYEIAISLIVMFAMAGCRGIHEISTNENFFHFFTLLKDRNASQFAVCTLENMLLCLSMVTDFEVPTWAVEFTKTSEFWNVMRPVMHIRASGTARLLINILPRVGAQVMKMERDHIWDFAGTVIMESDAFTIELLSAWKIMHHSSYSLDSPADDLSLITHTIDLYKTLCIDNRLVSQTMCAMLDSVRQKPRTPELLSVMSVLLDTDDSDLATLLDQYFMHTEQEILFEFLDGIDEATQTEFLERLIEQSNYIGTSGIYFLMSLVAIFVAKTHIVNRDVVKLCKRMKDETECRFLIDQIMALIDSEGLL